MLDDMPRGMMRREHHHPLTSWWALLAASLLAAPGITQAAETSTNTPASSWSLPVFLRQIPPEAKAVAPALRTLLQVAQTSRETDEAVRQFRTEYEDVKAKLVAATSELQLLNQQREQLVLDLSVQEREVRERVEALRRDLEAKLDRELSDVRQQKEKEQKEKGYYACERSYGAFYRAIPLPEGVKPDEAKAAFKDGVLEITMPAGKLPEKHGRRLEIKSA